MNIIKDYYRLVRPDAKALKSVIWKKKRHLDRENAVLPLKLLLKFIV